MLIETFHRWRLRRKAAKIIDSSVKHYGAETCRLTTEAGGVLALILTLPKATVGDLKQRFPEYADAFGDLPADLVRRQNFRIVWFDPKLSPCEDLRPVLDFYRDTFAHWEKHNGL